MNDVVEYADKNDIRRWIEMLAQSQGFYARLLRHLDEHPEGYDELAKQKFADILDMVLYLEA